MHDRTELCRTVQCRRATLLGFAAPNCAITLPMLSFALLDLTALCRYYAQLCRAVPSRCHAERDFTIAERYPA